MGTQKVNLDTYSLSLLTAKEDILNPRSSTNWALFAYDGVTNKLKLADSGAGGVAELAGKFHLCKPQYGLCKIGSGEMGGPRIAMIIWVGQNVDDYRRSECAGHILAIRSYFKEAHVFINAEKEGDVTEERIRADLNKGQAQASTQWARRNSRSTDKEELVGTNYRKTNAAMEMRRINRDSFWARAEREEEERKEEERRRAAEERRRLEKERILREKKDAEERDRKMEQKLQMIEEQRRKQTEKEEEMWRKEKSKWEQQQQRDHEEDMRACLRRSESIEKAAEAAALVSQRTMNPREFFRQLSSSSSQSPTSPGSSRSAGKPFRRYQRSLTDTAFIFSKTEESTASSPRSPPLVSPFSRIPPSPIYRSTTPPKSPDFRPVISPHRPTALASPPTSPLRTAPPLAFLPSDPQTNVQTHVESKTPSPTEPSAPPASPSIMTSLSQGLVKDRISELHSETLPASPPNTPNQPEQMTFDFDCDLSPMAPSVPLPDRPHVNTDLSTVCPELVLDTGFTVQAVLVEEDEEEELGENEEEKADTEPEHQAVITEPEPSEAEVQEIKKEEEEEEEEMEERVEEENEDTEENREEAEGSLKEDVETASGEEPTMMAKDGGGEENDQSEEESQVQFEPIEHLENEDAAYTVAEIAFQEIQDEAVYLSTNDITNREHTEDQNGIERSLSLSDTDLSSPELTGSYDLHGLSEEDHMTEVKEEEFLENGQEVLPEQQMCVRALYDYQAEDESEISFEPGDIIRDVETVDKAWWRGWSKDGRQGLFPANYVETI